MLDKFKQMKQLRELQESLKKKEFKGESNGVVVTINGAFELRDVKLNSDLETGAQEDAIKEAFSNAMQIAQKELRSVFGNMGM